MALCSFASVLGTYNALGDGLADGVDLRGVTTTTDSDADVDVGCDVSISTRSSSEQRFSL